MISMYKWHLVKVLRSKGVAIKKIARTMKLSKNRVWKYVRSLGPPRFKPRYYTVQPGDQVHYFFFQYIPGAERHPDQNIENSNMMRL